METPSPATSPSGRSALLRYLGTALIARTATESTTSAILLASFAVLGTATTGSYMVAGLIAAAALGGPVVGALLDRSRRLHRGFVTAMLTLAVGPALIAVLLGHAPTAVLIAIAAVAGLGYPGVIAAWTAQLPRLVAPESLPRAYAADAASYSTAAVIGAPAAAASLAISPTAPLWVPSLLLVLASITVLSVPLRPVAHHERPSIVADLRLGFSLIVTRPLLLRSVLVSSLSLAAQLALVISAPVLARDFTGSTGFTGVIVGAFAVGGVITSLVATRFPIRRPDRMMLLCALGAGVMLVVYRFAPNATVAVLAAFIMGMTDGPMVASTFQVRARESTPQVRTQVFTTAASTKMIFAAIAAAIYGSLLVHGTDSVIDAGIVLEVLAVIVALVIDGLRRSLQWGHGRPDRPRRKR